jgi:hypothetical protein
LKSLKGTFFIHQSEEGKKNKTKTKQNKKTKTIKIPRTNENVGKIKEKRKIPLIINEKTKKNEGTKKTKRTKKKKELLYKNKKTKRKEQCYLLDLSKNHIFPLLSLRARACVYFVKCE